MIEAQVISGNLVYDNGRSAPATMTPDGRLRVDAASTAPSLTNSRGSANFATSQASATTTAAPVATARSTRDAVTIENLGTTAVYLGGPGVTILNGFLLPGVVGASVTIPTTAAIYGVTSSGAQAVAVLETCQ